MNFYEQMPAKKDKYKDNPNFDVHGIEVPFRMVIIGGSGSMKTNTVLDIFQKFSGTFDHLTIVCRNKDEPLYNLLSESIPEDQLTIIEVVGDDLTDLPTMDGLNSDSPHTMVVFDDLCLVKKQDAICEFFIRARKVNISCAYLTQSYYACPKTIRINCNYVLFKKIESIRDLQMILREYSLGTDLDQLAALHEQCTQEKLDWLMISMQNDPDNRFFKNYTPISIDGQERPRPPPPADQQQKQHKQGSGDEDDEKKLPAGWTMSEDGLPIAPDRPYGFTDEMMAFLNSRVKQDKRDAARAPPPARVPLSAAAKKFKPSGGGSGGSGSSKAAGAADTKKSTK